MWAPQRASVLAAALVGIAVPAAWVWTTITPAEDGVRLRNAFGARIGVLSDFQWQPGQAPSDFKKNSVQVPVKFHELAQEIAATIPSGRQRDTDLAVAISRDLMKARERIGSPIRAGVAETYRQITNQGRGYCADFARVFNGITLAADLPVRQWGFAFNGFGSGHTFNEIYDRRLGRWVMVDSFHSLLFVDPETREPLSVLEVHDRLLAIGDERRDVEIVKIVENRFPFRSETLALDYYRRGMPQLWLVWGNETFGYEAHPMVIAASHVSRSGAQLVGRLAGVYPAIRIYPKGMSERDYRELVETRNEFLLASIMLLVSLLVFGAWVVGAWRAGRRHPAAPSNDD